MSEASDNIFQAPESDLAISADMSLSDAFVGETNAEYYRQRFEAFEAGGNRATWHWPAFLIGAFWLPYRKMWFLTAMYWLILPIASSIVLGFIALLSPTAGVVAEWLYYVVLYFGLGMAANHLYYQHAVRKVELVTQQYSDRDQQIAELQRIGGTSIIGYVLAGLAVLLFGAAIWAAFLGYL